MSLKEEGNRNKCREEYLVMTEVEIKGQDVSISKGMPGISRTAGN